MKLYARLSESGLVLETSELDPVTSFHPDIAQEFVEVPAEAATGDSIVNGKVVKAVAPDPLPVPVATETRHVPRTEFLGALTRAERLALTEFATNDAETADFLAMMEVAGHFDLNNQEDIDLLDRLEAADVLTQGSVAAIKQLR
jgi:hypothetical protein